MASTDRAQDGKVHDMTPETVSIDTWEAIILSGQMDDKQLNGFLIENPQIAAELRRRAEQRQARIVE